MGVDSEHECYISFCDSEVLTKAGAAEFLKVKPRTIDEWMRKRRIPFASSRAARFDSGGRSFWTSSQNMK